MKIPEKIIVWLTAAALFVVIFGFGTGLEALEIATRAATIWLAFAAAFLAVILVSVFFSNRGVRKLSRDDYKGAVREFTKALLYYPRFSLAYSNRRVAKLKSGDLEGAIANYNRAIKVNRKFPLPYANRGAAKVKMKDYEGALADYNRAIELKPDFALAYNNRGFLYAKQLKEFDKALEDCQKAVRTVSSCRLSQPASSYCYGSLGYAYACKGHFTKALADCQTAVNMSPENAAHWAVYACVLALINNKDEMLEKLAKAIEFDPKQKEEARKDRDFEPYSNDPEFKRLIEE
jgi:tetratricopeptide (TPR) repeat protein